MSIISTVHIPEGIIMSADSRLTGSTKHTNGVIDRHTISDNSQKLFLIKNNTVGIACCGDAIIASRSVGDFLRQFEIDKMSDDDTVITIANKLKDYTMSNHGIGVIYQVAGYIKDEPYVYKIISNKVEKANIDNDSKLAYGVIWEGEKETLHKLLTGTPRVQLDFQLMQLKDGIDFAEFLVDVTIKYQRFDARLATCGGAIDVLVITKDYAKFIKHKVLNP